MAEAAGENNKAALKNWADEVDDEDDGGDVEIGGSSVAQVGQQPKPAAAAASSEAADGDQTE